MVIHIHVGTVANTPYCSPPKIMPGSPYDIAPHEEHCCRVIANKSLHNSLSSRLVRWMLNSRYVIGQPHHPR